MTETLLETLKQQHDKGKRSDNGSKTETWNALWDAVAWVFGYGNLAVAQIKVKVNNLKLLWREWVELEKASGFG